MTTEYKFPITYRASIIVFIGTFIIFLDAVLWELLKFISAIFTTHSLASLFFLIGPFSFIPMVLMVLTYKTTIDEKGFRVSGLFLGQKDQVQWSEIAKIGATVGVLSSLEIYYRGMKSYKSIRLGMLLSKKSIGELFEIVVSKAPSAELGMGIAGFKKKYSKINTEGT